MPCFSTKPLFWLSFAVATSAFSTAAVWASAAPDLVVSQKNRMFNPHDVTLRRDHSLVIVNDDGDLLHHAYIESDDFNFDSGDQQPGSRTVITFPSSGDFKVLCGIHPKMKLVVHVQ